ncbi:MAG: hypothetical protein HC798_03050 [Polaribacter sp.]|nr:hypothetical protein [Polaribacter sp.]
MQSDFLQNDITAKDYIKNRPPSLYASVGFFDYNDLATQTTPLIAVANVPLKITNDKLGDYTNEDNQPYGVSGIWDSANNSFDFSELSVGDTVDLRVSLMPTTTTANQDFRVELKMGVGSASEFTIILDNEARKNSGRKNVYFLY